MTAQEIKLYLEQTFPDAKVKLSKIGHTNYIDARVGNSSISLTDNGCAAWNMEVYLGYFEDDLLTCLTDLKNFLDGIKHYA